jgi:hypothetical protein
MKNQILFAIVATVMMTGLAQAGETQVNMNDPNSNASIPKEQPQLGGQGCPFAKASTGEFSDAQKTAAKDKSSPATPHITGTVVQ